MEQKEITKTRLITSVVAKRVPLALCNPLLKD